MTSLTSYINRYGIPDFDLNAPIYNFIPSNYSDVFSGDFLDPLLSLARYGNWAGKAYGGAEISPPGAAPDMSVPVRDDFDAISRTHDMDYFVSSTILEEEKRLFEQAQINFQENINNGISLERASQILKEAELRFDTSQNIEALNIARADATFAKLAANLSMDSLYGEAIRLLGIITLGGRSLLENHDDELAAIISDANHYFQVLDNGSMRFIPQDNDSAYTAPALIFEADFKIEQSSGINGLYDYIRLKVDATNSNYSDSQIFEMVDKEASMDHKSLEIIRDGSTTIYTMFTRDTSDSIDTLAPGLTESEGVIIAEYEGQNFTFVDESIRFMSAEQNYNLANAVSDITQATDDLGTFLAKKAGVFSDELFSEEAFQQALGQFFAGVGQDLLNGTLDAEEAFQEFTKSLAANALQETLADSLSQSEYLQEFSRIIDQGLGLNVSNSAGFAQSFANSFADLGTQIAFNYDDWNSDDYLKAGAAVTVNAAATYYLAYETTTFSRTLADGTKVLNIDGGALISGASAIVTGVLGDQSVGQIAVNTGVSVGTYYASQAATTALVGTAAAPGPLAVALGLQGSISALSNVLAPVVGMVIGFVANKVVSHFFFEEPYFGENEYPTLQQALNSEFVLVTLDDGRLAVQATNENGSVLFTRPNDGISTIIGGVGNDNAIGSDGDDDVFYGGAGNDFLEGHGGDDRLLGNEDDDHLEGGAGDDLLHGGDGNDFLIGGAGQDAIDGGDGNDFIQGGDEADLITGSGGRDAIYGGAGNDVINSDYTQNPNPNYVAGSGQRNDVVVGGLGNDYIHGGKGDDVITGNEGQDHILGGEENDSIFGNQDDDTLIGNEGDDFIHGGQGSDILQGETGNDLLMGGQGDDYLSGGIADDSLDGGAGNDTLIGEVGDDILSGGDGDDSLDGGHGDDILIGGAGSDLLKGEEGDDIYYILAGDGVDTIQDTAGSNAIFLADGTASNTTLRRDGVDLMIHTALGENSTEIRVEDFWVSRNIASLFFSDGQSLDLASLSVPEDGGVADYTTENIISDTIVSLESRLESLQGTIDDRVSAMAGNPHSDWVNNSFGSIDGAVPQGDTYYNQVDIQHYTRRAGKWGDRYDVYGKHYEEQLFDVGDRVVGGWWDEHVIGNENANTIYGNSGIDIIQPGDGNDLVFAGPDLDAVEGGAGHDMIFGGAGNDRDPRTSFINDGEHVPAEFSEDEQQGVRYGHNPRQDLLNRFKNLEDSEAGLKGQSGNDTIYGGEGSDQIYGDSKTDIGGDDVAHGGEGSDEIYGRGGNDLLFGDGSDDLIDGGAGKDVLVGGEGNDTIYGDSHHVLIPIYYRISNTELRSWGVYKTDAPITGDSDVIYGNGGDDTIFAANNEIEFFGFIDDESLHLEFAIESGKHVIVSDTAYAPILRHTIQITEAAGNYINAGSGNDYVVGALGDDTIYGESGNDELIAMAGNDYIYGGTGNDVIQGNEGNDVIYGGDETEADEKSSQSFHVLNLGRPHAEGQENTFHDVIFGNEGEDYIVAGAGRDLIIGDQKENYYAPHFLMAHDPNVAGYFGADDTIFAGDGDDWVEADGGDDFVHGGAGNDRIMASLGDDEIHTGEGNDVVFAGAGNDNVFVGNGQNILYGRNEDPDIETPEINNIYFSGVTEGLRIFTYNHWQQGYYGLTFAKDTVFSGTENGETLLALAKDQFYRFENITATPYDDEIWGNFNDEMLHGGKGDDILVGAAGADTLDGGLGEDAASYSNSAVGVTIDLRLNTAQTGSTYLVPGTDILPTGEIINTLETVQSDESGDIFINIENVFGSAHVDILYGSDIANTISAGAGHDRIEGHGGDDLIYGWTGDDQINGGSGNDTLFGEQGHDNIHGGAGDDSLYGGEGNDYIAGEDGNDVIFASEGNDIVNAGLGDDTVYGDYGDNEIAGGEGDDTVYGGNDRDTIWGGTGNDFLLGNDGDDQIFGEDGEDRLYGGRGRDSIYGGSGRDLLSGGEGDDLLSGEGDDDQIFGYDGNDTIYGGAGNDSLGGENGDDTIYGDDGDDVIYSDGIGTIGNDTVYGGTGDDLIRAGSGHDFITGDAGQDDIYGEDGDDEIHGGAGDDFIDAGAGDDLVGGGAGADTIFGYDGNDSIFGNEGDDILYGLAGNDEIGGGMGADTIYGDIGDDVLFGQGGDDWISGWSGADIINGEDGDDQLFGEDGNDTVYGGAGNDILYGDRKPEASSVSGITAQDVIENTQSQIGIENWGLLYQGDTYNKDTLMNAPHDLLIINMAETVDDSQAAQSEVFWDDADIAEIQNAGDGKKLVGYLNLTKINTFNNNWDPDWVDDNGVAKDEYKFLGAQDPAFPTAYTANFGEPEWKDILFDRIDQIIEKGFSGVFLDDTLTYFFNKAFYETDDAARADNPDNIITDDSSTRAQDIVDGATVTRDLILELHHHAAEKIAAMNADDGGNRDPDEFLFVVNGAPYILSDIHFLDDDDTVRTTEDLAYLEAVDAILAENYFSRSLGDPNAINFITKIIEEFSDSGTALLSVDTGMATDQQKIEIMKLAVSYGFSPFATDNDRYDTLNAPFVADFGDSPAPGDDMLDGGAGADILNGGEGFDTASYASSAIGVTVSLADTSLNTGDAIGDIYLSIENIEGSSFDDILHGNGLANVLRGGFGADILYGGFGNDAYIFDAQDMDGAIDVIRDSGGSADAFDIIGDFGIDDILLEKDPSNTNHLIVSVLGQHIATVENHFTDGRIEHFRIINNNLPDVAHLIVTEFDSTEHPSADLLYYYGHGRSDNQWVVGGDRNERIYTGAGDDVIDPYGGNDLIGGGAGNDTYIFGKGYGVVNFVTAPGIGETADSGDDDTILLKDLNLNEVQLAHYASVNENTNIDEFRISYTHEDGSINYIRIPEVSVPHIENIVFADGTQIENLLLVDTISHEHPNVDGLRYAYATAESEWIISGLGRQNIYAGGGGDVVFGGYQRNLISGQDGDDTIYAGTENDWIDGGDGDDIIYGQAGQDIHIGGTGADTFVFDASDIGFNNNRIRDFSVEEGDIIRFESLLEGFDPLSNAISDFVEITEANNQSKIRIDVDGGGDSFQDIVRFETQTGGRTLVDFTIDDLIEGGRLEVV